MANLSLRRSGPPALVFAALSAIVIGCGGGGGGGTSGATTATDTTGTPTTGTADAGSIGGGTDGGTGLLPSNSIFYVKSNGANYDVDYVKEDGSGAGSYESGVTVGNVAASPDPSTAGRYVFAAAPSGSTKLGLYRNTTPTVTGAQTIVPSASGYGDVQSIQVSRDGSKVLYLAASSLTSALGLYVVPTAGGTPLFIDQAFAASLSSDGTRVVYSKSPSGGNTALYVRSLSGGTTSAQLTTTDVNADDPQFSKDGTKVVFSQGTVVGSALSYTLGVVTSAKTVTTITPFSAAANVTLRAPSFSPDGTRIAFVAADDAGTNTGLYTCDLAGGNLVRVVNSPLLLNSTYWTNLGGRAPGGPSLNLSLPRR